ncbi:MAG: hypothetical protein LUC96_05590 [Alistipes sp.]|uniref:DUF6047 family protein n=1 Tax=Alistipes sp. TaxID=1872444 RepID=UPI0025BB5558|nr:DUF6047 family protein [Alistipes sp.]MCD8274445.1 hypothetical protein [Alistipes sp.]
MEEARQKPTAVFMSVTPQSSTAAIQVLPMPYEQDDFRHFTDEALDQASQGPKALSDNWLFRYEFPNGSKLPHLSSDNDFNNYFRNIRKLAFSEGIRPAGIISLRDVLYCHNHDIDIFSEEAHHPNLIHAPGYKTISTRFGIFEEHAPQFPTCRAVDLGSGVLLYDTHIYAGREAYNSLLQHCADRFFDADFCIDRLRIYDLHPFLEESTLEKHLGILNLNLNYLKSDLSTKELLRLPLLEPDILKEGILVKEYDMKPLAENYSLFVTGENVQLKAGTRTFDIAVLDHIARHGYPAERLSEEWNFICPYTSQFKDLADKIISSESAKQIATYQSAAKERAQLFLDRDFPDRRQPTDMQREQLAIEQMQTIDIPSENFNRGHKI